MKADPVRLLALDLLVQVDRGALLDPLLDQALDGMTDQRSRAFLAELVRGSIQWRERYRQVLRSFVSRKFPEDDVLLQLFYLSLHQLLGLDGVAPFATIHQAGELCRVRVSEKQVGFVNGILQAVRRQILPDRQSDDQESGPDLREREQRMLPLFEELQDDPGRWLAAWYSHPQWLVQGWLERFGRERTEAICLANNRRAGLYFHVLEPADPRQASQDLEAAGCLVQATAWPRTLEVESRLGQPRLREILERLGYLIVQDVTVQQATSWLMEGREDLPEGLRWQESGLRVLDMCAAPGGKTARLAAGWQQDLPVVAMDNRPNRIALLRDTLQRTGLSEVRVLQGDGLDPPLTAGSCAAILLDGPCSGTGVLRHHPEGRWHLPRRSPRRNGQLLAKLAENAAELLAPGGLLMYATCSLEEQENEDVLKDVLAACPDLEPAPDGLGRWQRQWFPEIDGGDGFFAARLVKKNLARK